ncbi:MAG: TolC family protein, partial [candidate division KSB1 bacterium]|nr:TolC family protein [candidate division KSB1 bacterium]
EISMLIQRLAVLEQKRESLSALINRLLDRPPQAPLGRPAEVMKSPFDRTLEELNELALQRSPMLKMAERRIEEKQAALSLAKKEYLPNFQLNAMYNSRDRLEAMWEANVGVEIPLYFWRKQKKGVEEAQLNLSEAQNLHEKTKQELLFEVKDNFVMARTSDTLVRLYGTAIIPQSSLSLESAISGYEVGKVDFLTLLDNLLTLLNNELMYYEQLVDFQKALARLEAVVGVPLIE